jgi:hypothetical protein
MDFPDFCGHTVKPGSTRLQMPPSDLHQENKEEDVALLNQEVTSLLSRQPLWQFVIGASPTESSSPTRSNAQSLLKSRIPLLLN